jgi:hypothetical protein
MGKFFNKKPVVLSKDELDKRFKELEKEKELLKQQEIQKQERDIETAKYLEEQLKDKNEQYTKEIKDKNIKSVSYNTSFMEKIKIFFGKTRQILINMELQNGDFTSFIIFMSENIDCFKWGNKTFVIDESAKYYNIKFKTWCLDYHESLCLPVKRKVDVNGFIEELHKDGVTDVEMSINPLTLEYFITSSVIQKIIKGAEMEKVFDFIKLLLIIIGIICLAHFLLFIKASGILNNIHLPFVK